MTPLSKKRRKKAMLDLFCLVVLACVFSELLLYLPITSQRRGLLLFNLRVTEHSTASVMLSYRTWSWRQCGTTTSATCCPLHCRPTSRSAAPASPMATRSSRTQ